MLLLSRYGYKKIPILFIYVYNYIQYNHTSNLWFQNIKKFYT